MTFSVADDRRQLLLGLLVMDDIYGARSYSRYWHGYLIYLRPLLVWFDRGQILVLLGIGIAVLIVLLSHSLWRQGVEIALPVVMALLLTNIVVVVQALQFVQIYIIGIALALWVSRTTRRSRASIPMCSCSPGRRRPSSMC